MEEPISYQLPTTTTDLARRPSEKQQTSLANKGHSYALDDEQPADPVAKSSSTSALTKVLAGLALLPLLYVIRTFVLQPLATFVGQALVELTHDGVSRAQGQGEGSSRWVKREVEKGTGEFAAFATLIPVLVLLSGVFAGLTLGYMSLDMTQLTILTTSGSEVQQKYAKAIIPVRSNGHMLLVSLLLWNMIVNETLPIISDPVLGGGVQAVVASTALIIIFSEIIPQSICTRYGLLVGAKAAPLTQVLIWVMYPIAWPVSMLLEYILGRHNGIVYRKQELRELLNLHARAGHHGGDLQDGTVTMAQGALDLQDKVVRDSMTPADDVFMLPDTAKLDYAVLYEVVQSGHSRVPVYKEVDVPDLVNAGKTKRIKKILGILLVKNCVLLDPEDATPIMSIPLNTHFPTVPQDEPLLNMLAVFREGGSHMAVISRKTRAAATPADDESADEESIIGSAAIGLRERIRRKLAGSDTSDSSDGEDDVELGEIKKKKGSKQEEKQKAQEAERKKVLKEGQGVPGDAQVASAAVTKLMEDIENETVGIITLEDIIEDLLQSEIEDEHDKHDAEGHTVGAYIPQEAADIIAKANEDRMRAAAGKSASMPPPQTGTSTHVEKPVKSKTGLLANKLRPSLGLNMRRASSAPGRKRTADSQVDPETFASAAPSETILAGPTAGEQTDMKEINENEKMTFPATTQTSTNAPTITVESPVSTPSSTPVAQQPKIVASRPLTEALDRGRNKNVAKLVDSSAARSPSAPGSGTSTPLTGGPGDATRKKKVFKSTPVAPPTLQHASTFSGGLSPRSEEAPKKL